jgi:Glycosyl transferase family 2
MTRERVTACIVAQNEQRRLPAALESVAFCDEVIVVDGGSVDSTVELAREAGSRVIENAWPGFAAQRNRAIDAAATDWILEIDADERVSPQLRSSIEGLLASASSSPGIAVFALRNRFLGKSLGASAKYPAYRSRLFRRSLYRHDESRTVHEGIEPRERPTVLAGELEHELASTLREALRDTWRYARLESRHIQPSNAGAYAEGIVLRPIAKAAYRTIVDGGWRDGWRGLLKIALDAGYDALAWTFVLARELGHPPSGHPESGHPPSARRDVGPSQQTHFGRRPTGSPKLVAVAPRGAPSAAALQWLSGLRSQQLDVTLISDDPLLADGSPNRDVPVRTVRRLAPLTLIRALEVEAQLRTIDVVIPVGARAALLRRAVPATLWPSITKLGLGLRTEPREAAEQLRAALGRGNGRDAPRVSAVSSPPPQTAPDRRRAGR